MKGFLETFGVLLCGLATSILTAIAVVAISKVTGFDIFTFSLWFVVPVGALLTGFAAAAGYYFGSLYFHKRATWHLLIQMVVIAGVTQALIYYMGYATMVLDDGTKISDVIPFWNYLDILLTSAHYQVGRTMADTGEVGSFGYWLAGFQFVGFLVGGFAIWAFLQAKPICQKCDLYLRPLAKREKSFRDAEAASPYYDALFQHPVDGPEFSELIRSESKVQASAGALHIKTVLHGCPLCKAQLIEEEVQVYNGSEWKQVDKLHRKVQIPDGIDLVSVFRP